MHESIWRIKEKTSRAEIRMSSSLFRCVLASLKEGVSVHPSVGPSVRHTLFGFLRNGPNLNKVAPGKLCHLKDHSEKSRWADRQKHLMSEF